MEMHAEKTKHGENGRNGGKADKESARREDGEEVKNKGQTKTKYRDKRKKWAKKAAKQQIKSAGRK